MRIVVILCALLLADCAHNFPPPGNPGPSSRIDLYDAHSNRIGYGWARPDGSVELFRPDGRRLGTITPRIGGGTNITVPGRR